LLKEKKCEKKSLLQERKKSKERESLMYERKKQIKRDRRVLQLSPGAIKEITNHHQALQLAKLV
jgi:hypothetical protein